MELATSNEGGGLEKRRFIVADYANMLHMQQN